MVTGGVTGGSRIFIVDDDSSFGRSLKRLLNVRGFLADYFESALHFMDSVPSGQKGIVIVDIHMPECDGFGLMRKMQDMHYRMPVILITGRTEGFTRDIALQMGASAFLKKPFHERTLINLIEELELEGEESL